MVSGQFFAVKSLQFPVYFANPEHIAFICFFIQNNLHIILSLKSLNQTAVIPGLKFVLLTPQTGHTQSSDTFKSGAERWNQDPLLPDHKCIRTPGIRTSCSGGLLELCLSLQAAAAVCAGLAAPA